MKKNYKKIFWIYGLSGSGKSAIGKYILPHIKKKFGNTILINGDDIRNIYKFNNFDKKSRLNLGKNNFNFSLFLLRQNFNIIFTTVGLIHELQKYNRQKGKKFYVEIFIKSDINKLINKKSKYFYKKKTKNVFGVNLIPEFPKKPHITIENNFDKSIAELSKDLLSKINKIVL